MELFRLAAMLLAIGSAAAAALSLGGAASDRLDVLTHFSPFFFVGGVIALLVQLPFRGERDWLSIACGLAALVISTGLMAPELIGALADSRAAPGAQTVKVIQINLWGHNADPSKTADWLIAQDADVVVVEEAIVGGAAVPPLLSSHYPYRTDCAPPLQCTTLILSKAAPRDAGVYAAPDAAGKHSGAWANFGDRQTGFTVVGTHALWPAPPGPQQAQSRRLAAQLAAFDRPSLIVAGDFNSTPWSFSLRRQDRLFGLKRRTRALFTWPVRPWSRYGLWTPVPVMAIDHIYAGAAWKTVSVATGPRLGSDHLPVVAVLTR